MSPLGAPQPLSVEVPQDGYHRGLVSCQQACPVHTDARGYVRAIAEGRLDEAYLIARGPNPFASICGRICGAPCEAACRRGKIPRVGPDGEWVGPDAPIAIRALKRFACEQPAIESRHADATVALLREYTPRVGADADEMAALLRGAVAGRFTPAARQPVAIVGAGPAGLSAAHDLALLGFRPVVFESESVATGMLYLGVPEYRLPRELIRREVAVIEALGVEIRCGVAVGRDITFADLRARYAAVIVAVGAKRPRMLGLPGESGPAVYGGVDFLRAIALGEPIQLGHEIVVIGGGNVAYDVARTVLRQIAYDTARTALRMGGRVVRLAALETLEEMPADTVEIVEGDEEGIERLNGWGPVEIVREGPAVKGVWFRRCKRAYDESRRFAPEFDDTDRRFVPCDTVLLAAGQAPDTSWMHPGGEDVQEGRPGWPRVDAATLATSAAGVFVAGDLAHGTRLLIDAVASGKKAARSVYAFVTGQALAPELLEAHLRLDGYRREGAYETRPRVVLPTLEPHERLAAPGRSVECPLDPAAAQLEAARCLDCGVTPVFDGSRCVLCGGCVDVCPTQCLKIVPLSQLAPSVELDAAIGRALGADAGRDANAAILKDEDRCIRCALCAQRCPVDAIAMERVRFDVLWRNVS